jgi:ubiquinone/menaquinone biosynthesis C-methylase UbiE
MFGYDGLLINSPVDQERPVERSPLLNPRQKIDRHYGVGGVLDAILHTLSEMGKDLTQLRPKDLAPVDEFHVRGREATVELAHFAGLRPGSRVLDVGCGLGGSVRYLADEYQCRATGIDLTKEYVETARTLAERVGLAAKAQFIQASALDMPFAGSSFDVVWTEHAQMNIADKSKFLFEVARVLNPGGRFVFHDIFQGEGGEPHYPLPWAAEPSISFMDTVESLQTSLQKAQLAVLSWEDKSQRSLEWFAAVSEKLKKSGRPPLGLHLLMGGNAKLKSQNQIRNLQEKRIAVIQAVAKKGGAEMRLGSD